MPKKASRSKGSRAGSRSRGSKSNGGAHHMWIVGAVVFVVFAGLAYYLYEMYESVDITDDQKRKFTLEFGKYKATDGSSTTAEINAPDSDAKKKDNDVVFSIKVKDGQVVEKGDMKKGTSEGTYVDVSDSGKTVTFGTSDKKEIMSTSQAFGNASQFKVGKATKA